MPRIKKDKFGGKYIQVDNGDQIHQFSFVGFICTKKPKWDKVIKPKLKEIKEPLENELKEEEVSQLDLQIDFDVKHKEK